MLSWFCRSIYVYYCVALCDNKYSNSLSLDIPCMLINSHALTHLTAILALISPSCCSHNQCLPLSIPSLSRHCYWNYLRHWPRELPISIKSVLEPQLWFFHSLIQSKAPSPGPFNAQQPADRILPFWINSQNPSHRNRATIGMPVNHIWHLNWLHS